MSIVNEFSAKTVRHSTSEKTVYVIDEHNHRSTFRFAIYCKRSVSQTGIPMHFFFNLNTHQCFMTYRSFEFNGSDSKYKCQLLRFWLQDDLPILSVKLFDNQESIMHEIADQFREQYGAIILDSIIQQD